jgi:hypothetical protein
MKAAIDVITKVQSARVCRAIGLSFLVVANST